MRPYSAAKRLAIGAVGVILIPLAGLFLPGDSQEMAYFFLGLLGVCWGLIAPLLLLGALMALTVGFLRGRSDARPEHSTGPLMVWAWTGVAVLLTALCYPLIASDSGLSAAILPGAAVGFLPVVLMRSRRRGVVLAPGKARRNGRMAGAQSVVVAVIVIAAPLAMLHANSLREYRYAYLGLHEAKGSLVNSLLAIPAYRALACHRHASTVVELESGERVLSKLRPPILPQGSIDDVASAFAQARIAAVDDYDPSACEDEARAFAEKLAARGVAAASYDWARVDTAQLLEDVGTPYQETGVVNGRHYPDRLSDWEVNFFTLADTERERARAWAQTREHAAEHEAAERLYDNQRMIELRQSIQIALRSAPDAAEEILEMAESPDPESQQLLIGSARAARGSNPEEALTWLNAYVTVADRVLNEGD